MLNQQMRAVTQLLLGNLDSRRVKTGGISASSLAQIITDRDVNLVYSPAPQAADANAPWYQYADDTEQYNNTVTQANGDHVTTQTVQYAFVGTGIEVVGSRASNCGKIDVQIDGGTATTVDLYSASRRGRTTVYSVANLQYGPHTILITARNDKNASATDYHFYFNGFRVGTVINLGSTSLASVNLRFTGTTDANGYLFADCRNVMPAGYSAIGVIGARLITPNPASADANKPKICSDEYSVTVYDGPVSNTVVFDVSWVVMKT